MNIKFFRLVAKMMMKNKFPVEKPLGTIADPVLMVFDAIAAQVHATSSRERPAKRLKTAPKRGVKNAAATGELQQPGDSKKLKSQTSNSGAAKSSTPEEQSNMSQIADVISRVEQILPRVGKKQIALQS